MTPDSQAERRLAGDTMEYKWIPARRSVYDLSVRGPLVDLNRTSLPTDTRYQILEALAPALDRALTNLAKRFLNQPLVLPKEPREMATASDQLLSAVTTGYAIVAIEAVQKSNSTGFWPESGESVSITSLISQMPLWEDFRSGF